MALIQTIAEIKSVLPNLVSNLKDTSQLPNFERVEKKYLQPITGKALLDDLQAKYNTNTLSEGEKGLLHHMQLVIAAYGFLDELAFSHSKITDGGVRTLNTGQLPKAVGWEYRELKNALTDAAFDGVETLIAALYDFGSTLWTESSSYKALKSLLIKTGAEFNEFVALHQPHRTYWNIKTVVADVQENYVHNAIGPDLLDYFLSVENPTEEELYIMRLLKKALAHYTIKHVCEQYSVRFDGHGFTVVSDNGDSGNGETAGRTFTKDLIDLKMRAADRDGAAYLAKALYHLNLWNGDEDVSETFKNAYASGPLASYKKPVDRDRGNSRRNIFRM